MWAPTPLTNGVITHLSRGEITPVTHLYKAIYKGRSFFGETIGWPVAPLWHSHIEDTLSCTLNGCVATSLRIVHQCCYSQSSHCHHPPNCPHRQWEPFHLRVSFPWWWCLIVTLGFQLLSLLLLHLHELPRDDAILEMLNLEFRLTHLRNVIGAHLVIMLFNQMETVL